MNASFLLGSLFVVPFLSVEGQSIFQWSTASGGNGHFYEFISAPGATWHEARDAAVARGGYLATITSQAENDAIWEKWKYRYYWIGGYQTPGSTEPASGWAWVTGEEFVFQNWAFGQPDNFQGNENFLEFDGAAGKWNDMTPFRSVLEFGYVVEYDVIAPSAHPLPEHQHNPSDGFSAIKDFRIAANGQCLFTFSTAQPGAKCLVSWTGNLRQWFPLLQFNATTAGTEVVDFPQEPSKFYRTTYLPLGAEVADSFSYPIGTGSVDEQIEPEQNDLYPGASESNVERPTSGQPIDGNKWRNAQDVASYYLTSKGPGYHAGEDWNLGSGPDDIGEPVRSVANGVVVDIAPLNNNSNGGWAMVIRHYLLNGEVMDSVYLHIAPPTLSDHSSPNLDGAIGVESWFPFQEGMPVSEGSVVAVIADVDAAVYHDHLHFEMRNKAISGLPLATGTAAVSAYWPHSMGNAYYATFSAMQQDGIIDPSDFIDQN